MPAQESASLEARAATVIALKSRLLDTSRPEPALPEALRARPADSIADEVVLVKFPGPVTARQVQALRAASLQVYTYLPYYSYLVKMPAGVRTKSLLSSLGASWSGPYHPAYKISPEIAAVGAEDAEATVKSSRPVLPVMIHVLPDADLSEVMQTMKDLGVKGIVGSRRDPHFSRVRLLLTLAEIASLREPLAAMRDVFWIDLEGRKALRNDTTIWVGQSGLTGGQTTPIFSQGIFGEGQVVGIIDTGIDPDMCFFRDTGLSVHRRVLTALLGAAQTQ